MLSLLIVLLKGLVVIGMVLTLVALLTFVERKIAAFVQGRIGPERVGIFGFLQPVADGMKTLVKEAFRPGRAYPTLYIIAPLITFVPPLLAFASIPFSRVFHVIDTSLGVIYVLAISSLGVWGVLIGGWASDNKFSLLGALRSASQMISYEVALGLAVLSVLIMFGTFDFIKIVEEQRSYLWGIVKAPLAFLVAFIASFAETARIPFDVPEAESELVGGFHTEYAGMRFALFFLGEYAHLILSSCVLALLFFGGWNIPVKIGEGAQTLKGLLEFAVFSVKVFFFIFVFIVARWTLPRFRFDQVIRIGWGALVPLGLISVLVSGLSVALAG